jgi:hypothetical protein
MSDVNVMEPEVETKAAKKMVIKVTGPDAAGAFEFVASFAHGAVHSFVLSPEDPQFVAFAVHGVKQKLSDAGSTKKESVDSEAAVSALIGAFEQGEWGVKGERGEASPTGGLLAKALANLYGKGLPEVQAYLLSLHEDDKERAKIHNALRNDATVAAEIERIRPAKKEKKVSGDAAQRAAAALAGLQ